MRQSHLERNLKCLLGTYDRADPVNVVPQPNMAATSDVCIIF